MTELEKKLKELTKVYLTTKSKILKKDTYKAICKIRKEMGK